MRVALEGNRWWPYLLHSLGYDGSPVRVNLHGEGSPVNRQKGVLKLCSKVPVLSSSNEVEFRIESESNCETILQVSLFTRRTMYFVVFPIVLLCGATLLDPGAPLVFPRGDL